MDGQSADYRAYINDEFSARKMRNNAYSWRGFARDIGMPPGQLSSVLNRRYGLSRARAQKVALRMGLGPEESTLFCDLVEAEHGRSRAARQKAKTALEADAGGLSLDAFKLVADWYHFAILELAELDGQRLDPRSIPRRLGVTPATAKAAVERLQRLGLLEERRGCLAATTQETFAPRGVIDRSKRRFLEQMAVRATEALEQQDPSEREFSADMASFAVDDLPELRQLVRDFRRKIAALALKPGKKTAVYCINVQCFKVAE